MRFWNVCAFFSPLLWICESFFLNAPCKLAAWEMFFSYLRYRKQNDERVDVWTVWMPVSFPSLYKNNIINDFCSWYSNRKIPQAALLCCFLSLSLSLFASAMPQISVKVLFCEDKNVYRVQRRNDFIHWIVSRFNIHSSWMLKSYWKHKEEFSQRTNISNVKIWVDNKFVVVNTRIPILFWDLQQNRTMNLNFADCKMYSPCDE